MATSLSNLSEYDKNTIPNSADFKVGIVVSEWNGHLTSKLLEGAKHTLLENGVLEGNITIQQVPGAFELPLASKWLLSNETIDGVIAIGIVIQGETKHFDYVCSGTTQGIMETMLAMNKPISFCLLTDNTEQQSIDRSGGKHGNKGIEAAVTVLKMIALQKFL